MNPTRRKWATPVIAAILALLTTIVVVGYLQSLHRPVITQPSAIQSVDVVVATANIAERSVVRADQLAIRQMPSTAVQPRAARRIQDAVGRVALGPIYADQQVIQDALAPVGANLGLSYILPPGKLAMTIPVNEVVDVAGFVFPGDRIDVIGTVTTAQDQTLSKIFLQNIPVLAVAQSVEQQPGGQPKVSTSATLALTPEQAEMLTQVDTNGRIRLALRPAGTSPEAQTAGATTMDALRLPAPALPPVVSAQAPQSRPHVGAPSVPQSHPVEIWRSTTKSSVQF